MTLYWGESIKYITDDASGMISVTFDYWDEDDDNVAYISSLVVSEDKRGQGIGKTLLHEAENAIRNKGYNYAKLCVEKSNEWVVDWYKREGYREVNMNGYDEEDRKYLLWMVKDIK